MVESMRTLRRDGQTDGRTDGTDYIGPKSGSKKHTKYKQSEHKLFSPRTSTVHLFQQQTKNQMRSGYL